MPADLLALYENKQDSVGQEEKEEMIAFLLDTFPEVRHPQADYFWV